MPLNSLRLNHAPSSHPNNRIVFIKPLPRPARLQHEYETADTILRAIAAQCLPVMKNNWLSVTTLEEHEPNIEFIGRNFNNGEVIQLVLKSGHRAGTHSVSVKTKRGGGQQGELVRNAEANDSGMVEGRWLPFHTVQMVMMHELAHNVQMNHGRAFWKVRNQFAEEMRQLWISGYTGEGLWGSGQTLQDIDRTMAGQGGVVPSEQLKDLPVCGGTFRSRRRKRRKKGGLGEELTWKEKRDRRIEKKFGKNGVSLGEDEDKRLNLEVLGKGPVGGKPRVAKSKTGRELRAAAALARFSTNKQEVEALDQQGKEHGEQETSDGSGEIEDWEDDEYEEVEQGEEATDIDGQRLLDRHGRSMFKVYGDEDEDGFHVKQEIDELTSLQQWLATGQDFSAQNQSGQEHSTATQIQRRGPRGTVHGFIEHREPVLEASSSSQLLPITSKPELETKSRKNFDAEDSKLPASRRTTRSETSHSSPSPAPPAPALPVAALPPPIEQQLSCPICTTTNPPQAVTCTTCSHVLDPQKDPKSWRCIGSDVCRTGTREYRNPGDAGVCGVCGMRRNS